MTRSRARIRTYEIDLSSDNAARPTEAMRRFMSRAAVGDEERGEDPTVVELEEMVADLTGKAAAVFMPSGTMCNVVAYFVHCEPGDEIILHESSHPVYSGYTGPAVRGRASVHLLAGERGIFTGAQVLEAIQRNSPAKPRSRLVSVENTHNRGGGSVWTLAQIEDVCSVARANGLRAHLDGARLLNAVVASGVSAAEYCAPFDSAWIDLSKGLGCPMGGVLAGDTGFVAEARRGKYLFGGLMHKAGIEAAAGIYALRHHVSRLAEDHALARELARGLAEIPGLELRATPVQTNIVYFDVSGAGLDSATLLELVAPAGVRFKAVAATVLRAVTHLGIRPEHIPRAVEAVRSAVASAGRCRSLRV